MEIVVVHSIRFKNRYEKDILFGCLYRGYLNVQEKTPKRLTVDAPSKNESSQRLQNFDFVRKQETEKPNQLFNHLCSYNLSAQQPLHPSWFAYNEPNPSAKEDHKLRHVCGSWKIHSVLSQNASQSRRPQNQFIS